MDMIMVMGVMRQKVSPFKTDGAMTAMMMETPYTDDKYHCQKENRQENRKTRICGAGNIHITKLAIKFCI